MDRVIYGLSFVAASLNHYLNKSQSIVYAVCYRANDRVERISS